MQFGKSVGTADSIRIEFFSSIEDAEKFCEERTDLDRKYWDYCEIINESEEVELYYNG